MCGHPIKTVLDEIKESIQHGEDEVTIPASDDEDEDKDCEAAAGIAIARREALDVDAPLSAARQAAPVKQTKPAKPKEEVVKLDKLEDPLKQGRKWNRGEGRGYSCSKCGFTAGWAKTGVEHWKKPCEPVRYKPGTIAAFGMKVRPDVAAPVTVAAVDAAAPENAKIFLSIFSLLFRHSGVGLHE